MARTENGCFSRMLRLCLLCIVMTRGILHEQCAAVEGVFCKEGMVQVNGVELYYKTLGEGTPIVILHGGPGLEHTYLLPQMGKLAEDYRLIFYDQRATGRSTGAVDSASITMENFIKDLEGIRHTLGLERMNLLGHSFGGVLAMHYAIQYPEKLDSLILLNSGGASSEFLTGPGNPKCRMLPEDSEALTELMASQGFRSMERKSMEQFFRLRFKKNFYDKSLAASLTISFTENTAKNVAYINPMMLENLGDFDIYDRLRSISCPTLIIHSEYDPVRLELIKRIDENIPRSDLVVIKKCGHFPYIEAQDELFATLRSFLAGIRELENCAGRGAGDG